MADDKRCARCGEPRDAHIDMRDGKPTNGKYLVIFLCPTTVYKPSREAPAVTNSEKQTVFAVKDDSSKGYVEAALQMLDQLNIYGDTEEHRKLKEAQHVLHELRRLL